MIILDKFWNLVRDRSISTYWLQRNCDLDTRALRRLRANDNMETKTPNKICTALDCKLEDIAEFVKDADDT